MYSVLAAAAIGIIIDFVIFCRYEMREGYRDMELRIKSCASGAVLGSLAGAAFAVLVVSNFVPTIDVYLPQMHLLPITTTDGRDGVYVIDNGASFLINVRRDDGTTAITEIPNDEKRVFISQDYAIVGDGTVKRSGSLPDASSKLRGWALGLDYVVSVSHEHIIVPLGSVVRNAVPRK